MINLITSFFRPKQQKRIDELIKCLKKNIESHYIKKIYLFMENKEDIEYLKATIKITRNKIQLILWDRQPFYSDYLNLANQLKDEICMISNADIWLKQCDNDLLNLLNEQPNIAYSLTRHEYDGSTPMITTFSVGDAGSFDAFLFKTPKFVTGNIDHVQNIPGSEHIFKYFMENSANITFLNVCKDIVIVHEHKSGIRNYQNGDLIFPSGTSKYTNIKDWPGSTDTSYPNYKNLKSTPPISKKEFIRRITQLPSLPNINKVFRPMSLY